MAKNDNLRSLVDMAGDMVRSTGNDNLAVVGLAEIMNDMTTEELFGQATLSVAKSANLENRHGSSSEEVQTGYLRAAALANLATARWLQEQAAPDPSSAVH